MMQLKSCIASFAEIDFVPLVMAIKFKETHLIQCSHTHFLSHLLKLLLLLLEAVGGGFSAIFCWGYFWLI